MIPLGQTAGQRIMVALEAPILAAAGAALAREAGEVGTAAPLADLASIAHRNPVHKAVPRMSALRIGVGGPVGSGKTALMDRLCKAMRGRYDIAAITNDIYTK